MNQPIVNDVNEYGDYSNFRSNPNLRSKGTVISYTKEMIDEMIKCKLDPVYFIKNYVKVVHPDRGIVLMELYEYQERMVNAYHNNRRVIFLTARQQGKCLINNTEVNIRNKTDGKVVKLTLGELYEWQAFGRTYTENVLQEMCNTVLSQEQKYNETTNVDIQTRRISDTIERKFVDSVEVSDWEIETEDGWVDITHINKTIEYDVWQLTTTSSFIECADNHILFRENHDEVFVKDLIPGDKIIGQHGIEIVASVVKTDRKENMYDISVTGNHTFYAEGLLHHNTTVSAAYFVWYSLFNDNKSIAIMANKQSTAFEIMDRFRLAYENLPKWMQQGVEVWNRGSVTLENGSKVFGAATSKSGVRGKTVNLLYLDEFAFVENNQAEEFFTAVYPTITAGKETKVFMTSTPNGFNHFYKFWNDAEHNRNGFTPLRVHWYETPGRDQKWYNEQKSVLGELKAAQELDAEFLGSSKQLLTSATMARLSPDDPIKEYTDQYDGLKVYSYPVENRMYTMTVDVSRGRHLDASAFMVFDVSEYPHRIVATYNNKEIAPLKYAGLIHHVAKKYNNAYVLVEINDVGAQVAEELYYTYEYTEMYWTKGGDLLGRFGAEPYPGIRTTKKTKRIGCANLKDIVEQQQLIVNDYLAIKELSTFVQSDSGSYEADEGFHDDMCMCLVLFAWLCTQPWFVDLTDRNMRNQMYMQLESQMESDLMFFEYNDGTDSYQDDGLTPEERGLKELL